MLYAVLFFCICFKYLRGSCNLYSQKDITPKGLKPILFSTLNESG